MELPSPKTVPWTYSGSGFLYNTVAELRAAYDLNPLYQSGYDGSGQTVVIVDAYGSPTIYEDLLNFIVWQNSRGANLPWTTKEDVQSHLHIYYPTGKPTFSPRNSHDQIGWGIETTLDVCMVHAIAPGADIALVVAASSGGNVLNLAVNYAITNRLGSVISQSFGIPEFLLKGNNGQFLQAHNNYLLAEQYGITVFASTGDDGATNGGPLNNALYPSSDPYVTAVGGTNLFMTCSPSYTEGIGLWSSRPTGTVGQTYYKEIAGNDYEAMVIDGYPSPEEIVTTGGAVSRLFPLPTWQSGLVLTYRNGSTATPTMRVVSDVSYDSGVYGGIGIIPYSALGATSYYIVGGTSAGSPFWAALTALACQYKGSSLGYINQKLYTHLGTAYSSGSFHDIIAGDNTFPNSGSVLGYKATTGWDAPTGIGSPDASILVPIMAGW